MLSDIQRGGCVTKMASKYIVLVLYLIFLNGSLVMASTEDKLSSLEQTVDTLQQNVSYIRQNMATADVLRLYLTEEISFRDDLRMQLKELATNYTVLRDLYIQSTVAQKQQEIRIQELTTKFNSSQTLLKNCQSALQAELRKNLSDISSEFRTNFTAIRSDLDFNISTLQNSLNQFTAKGW